MAEKKFRSFAGTLYPDSESYDCEQLLSIIRSKFTDKQRGVARPTQ